MAKWKALAPEDVSKELARLQRMKTKSLSPDLKKWHSQRVSILKKVRLPCLFWWGREPHPLDPSCLSPCPNLTQHILLRGVGTKPSDVDVDLPHTNLCFTMDPIFTAQFQLSLWFLRDVQQHLKQKNGLLFVNMRPLR